MGSSLLKGSVTRSVSDEKRPFASRRHPKTTRSLCHRRRSRTWLGGGERRRRLAALSLLRCRERIGKLCSGADSELAVRARQVHFDSSRSHEEGLGNLAIRH